VARSAGIGEDELRDEEMVEHMIAITQWLWEPLRHAGPFDFADRAFLERGLELQVHAIARRYTRSRPINVWLMRSFYGLRALAWKLGAAIDVGALHRAEAQRVGFYAESSP
jgi:hypothetical protein